MKALTIWQPWASLIIAGAKPFEWRGWPAPKRFIGQRIVIHAAKRPVQISEIREVLDDLASGESSLKDTAWSLLEKAHLKPWPLSAGLGTAILGEPIRALDWAEKNLTPGFDRDGIDASKWAWPVSEIVPWEPVRPMRGMQGLWEWPEAI